MKSILPLYYIFTELSIQHNKIDKFSIYIKEETKREKQHGKH